MSTICLGVTVKGIKCNARVKNPDHYCFRHKNQNLISIKSTSKKLEPKIIVTKDFDDVCSICLCDVDKEDDCDLLCGHRHHVDCIKQVIKNECPVCKEPLIFGKKNSIDIEHIKKKETNFIKEMHTNQEATNALVSELANQYMNNNISNNNTNDNSYQIAMDNSLLDIEKVNIQKVIEESLLLQEIEQYEIEVKLIQESYIEAEQQEHIRVEKLKTLSLHDWLDAIFDTKDSIILKLK
jgi:hypothetical protein